MGATYNPFRGDPGHVRARRTAFGWVVLYDRQKGGDWIDADTRWVMAAYNDLNQNIGLLDCESRAWGFAAMADTVLGWHDWIGEFQDAKALAPA